VSNESANSELMEAMDALRLEKDELKAVCVQLKEQLDTSNCTATAVQEENERLMAQVEDLQTAASATEALQQSKSELEVTNTVLMEENDKLVAELMEASGSTCMTFEGATGELGMETGTIDVAPGSAAYVSIGGTQAHSFTLVGASPDQTDTPAVFLHGDALILYSAALDSAAAMEQLGHPGIPQFKYDETVQFDAFVAKLAEYKRRHSPRGQGFQRIAFVCCEPSDSDDDNLVLQHQQPEGSTDHPLQRMMGVLGAAVVGGGHVDLINCPTACCSDPAAAVTNASIGTETQTVFSLSETMEMEASRAELYFRANPGSLEESEAAMSKGDIDNLLTQLADARRACVQKDQDYWTAKNALGAQEGDLARLQTELETLGQEKQCVEMGNQNAKTEIAALKVQLETIIKDHAADDSKKEEEGNAPTVAANEDSVKVDFEVAKLELADAKTQVGVLQEQLASVQGERDRLQADHAGMTSDFQALQGRTTAMSNENAELKESEEALTDEIAGLSVKEEALVANVAVLDETVRQKTADAEALARQIETTVRLNEQLALENAKLQQKLEQSSAVPAAGTVGNGKSENGNSGDATAAASGFFGSNTGTANASDFFGSTSANASTAVAVFGGDAAMLPTSDTDTTQADTQVAALLAERKELEEELQTTTELYTEQADEIARLTMALEDTVPLATTEALSAQVAALEVDKVALAAAVGAATAAAEAAAASGSTVVHGGVEGNEAAAASLQEQQTEMELEVQSLTELHNEATDEIATLNVSLESATQNAASLRDEIATLNISLANATGNANLLQTKVVQLEEEKTAAAMLALKSANQIQNPTSTTGDPSIFVPPPMNSTTRTDSGGAAALFGAPPSDTASVFGASPSFPPSSGTPLLVLYANQYRLSCSMLFYFHHQKTFLFSITRALPTCPCVFQLRSQSAFLHMSNAIATSLSAVSASSLPWQRIFPY
jgi:predicted nuclease with TOPRIM domain